MADLGYLGSSPFRAQADAPVPHRKSHCSLDCLVGPEAPGNRNPLRQTSQGLKVTSGAILWNVWGLDSPPLLSELTTAQQCLGVGVCPHLTDEETEPQRCSQKAAGQDPNPAPHRLPA